MKTKIKIPICLLLFFLIFGCKKQDLVNETPPQPDSISGKTKTWLNEQSGVLNYQKVLLENKVIDVPQKILWEKSRYFAEFKTSITPVSIVSVTGSLPTYKYLVTETNEEGNVIKANYYAVFTDKKITESSENSAIAPDFLNLQNIPDDFTGAIIKYDLNNNIILTKHYEEGILSNKTDKVSVKKSKINAPLENYAPLPENCSYVTIDWYWQVYVNGVLVYEEYLGSSVVVICDDEGNGGGGGGGGGTPSCEQQNENFINQGVAISGPVYIVEGSNNGTTWIRNYNWGIFTAGTWGLLSYEKGTLEKIHYPNIDRWEFQAFEHIRITDAGTVIGGTRTFEDLGATINLTPTHTSAWVQVDFKVTSRVLCWPLPPVAIPYNATKTFYAPNYVVAE